MADIFERLSTALADRYLIERELGAGGMATVYLAQDVRHKRQVAVKVLRPDLAAVLGADRFLREIEIAAKLQHPHILTLIDSGEADGFLYYVMPFVEGESLRAKLDRERELPVPEAVHLLREVVDALVRAHGSGVVHRDIKPDNVLLSGRHAMVTDFGIAKAVSDATGAHQITTAGVALGTPSYMAPEQAMADPHVDHRADIYAVGAMAYEMLAGHPPFEGGSPQAVLSAHITKAPPVVTDTRPTVPPALSAAVMKFLEKKPADRWQSAEELHRELQMLATPSGGTAPVTAVSPLPLPRRAFLAWGVAVVAVLGVVGYFALRGNGAPNLVDTGNRIAVIPFSPSGDDTALVRLGRDLVVLLSTNLDDVGGIEVVDHTTVLSKTKRAQHYSLEEAAQLSRNLGAASFLHGTLVRTGDNVVLDAGLFASREGQQLGRASVTAAAGDAVALTDSTTWAVLRSIWNTGDAPTPSVASITTRSVPALRSFLDGEAAMTRGEWVKANDDYYRAIEADTTFWLAHLRYRVANGWSLGAAGPRRPLFKSLAEIRDSLPPRERMQADARLAPTWEETFAIGDRLIQRYPDYWPGIMDQADRLTHNGPYHGRSIDEARDLYQQILDIDPDFLPSFEHLFFIALAKRDAATARAAIDSIRKRNPRGGDYYAPSFDWVEITDVWDGQLRAIENPELYRTPPTTHQVDSMLAIVDQTKGILPGPVLATAFLPPDEWGIAAARALVAGGDRAMADAGYQRLGLFWAGRGAWDSAAVAMERYGRWSSNPAALLRSYRLAVSGVSVGALNVETARAARAALEGYIGDLSPGFTAQVPLLDGLLAFSQGNASSLEAARRRLEDLNAPAVDAYQEILAAFSQALAGDDVQAAHRIVEIEWQTTSVMHQVTLLLAGNWLLRAGETGMADRVLQWHESFPAGAIAFYDGAFDAIARLQRAHVAEAEGRSDDAVRFYTQFLDMYDMPNEKHRHLREEAQAALTRLTQQAR